MRDLLVTATRVERMSTMEATTPRNHAGLGRRRLMTTMAGFALATGLLAGQTTGAAAFSVSSTGSPGLVQVPAMMGFSSNFATTNLGFEGRIGYRSPAYAQYTQVISATYEFWQWSGSSWRLVGSQRYSGSAAPSHTGITFPLWLPKATMGSSYTARVTFAWHTTNGALIGTKVIDYNANGDYAYGSPCYACVIQTVGGRGSIFFGG